MHHGLRGAAADADEACARDHAVATGVPIVVERATYSDAAGVFWAAGSNQVATRVR